MKREGTRHETHLIYSAPEGHMLDENSGMYYSSVMGSDPATGAPVRWITWFNPYTGEYRQKRRRLLK
jgi:hypothetical protein